MVQVGRRKHENRQQQFENTRDTMCRGSRWRKSPSFTDEASIASVFLPQVCVLNSSLLQLQLLFAPLCCSSPLTMSLHDTDDGHTVDAKQPIVKYQRQDHKFTLRQTPPSCQRCDAWYQLVVLMKSGEGDSSFHPLLITKAWLSLIWLDVANNWTWKRSKQPLVRAGCVWILRLMAPGWCLGTKSLRICIKIGFSHLRSRLIQKKLICEAFDTRSKQCLRHVYFSFSFWHKEVLFKPVNSLKADEIRICLFRLQSRHGTDENRWVFLLRERIVGMERVSAAYYCSWS